MREQLRRVLRICSRLDHEAENPNPPRDLPQARIVHVPDRGEIFVREGEGPDGALPVLLLHGWTATADTTWFALYPALAGRHGFLAIDQRGHGRGIRAEAPFSLEACADDAAALLELLDIERAIVAGYSMGGAVALLMWQRHRELVAGLVMTATALHWCSTSRERLLWRSVTLLDVALRLGTGDGFVQRYLREAVEQSPEVAELRAWVSGEYKRGFSRDLRAAGTGLSQFDARSIASSIDVPCATVVTTQDQLVRPFKQRELAEGLGSPVFELDGDHDAPLVKAKEFADVMQEAIASVAQSCSAKSRDTGATSKGS